MVTRVFNLLYREVRGLHQAAYVVALFTLASQILAVVRDRILAHQFGAGFELDWYYTAFRIPDLLFVLFASVLSVYVLLPFVTKAEAAAALTGRVVLSQFFTLFLLIYSTVAFIVMLTVPYFLPTLFPGYDTEAYSTIVLMTQILLLQPFLLGLSSLCGVVTQLQHRFVIYALSPLLYNIGIIIGAAFLFPVFGLVGLVAGVIIGALGHLLVQWPLVRGSSYSFGLVRHIDWSLIRSVCKVALPRALTLSLGQIQFVVFVMIASTMTVGSVAVLQLAFNLQSVPLAIIGMSYSVAAFPLLAELLAKGEQKKFTSYVFIALRHIIFWSLPIMALVVVLRAQIVRVLLGSGAFNWDDTRLTAAVLALFVVSLVGQAILLLLVRAFYAGGKTLVPLIVTGVGVVVGVVTAYLLAQSFAAESVMTMAMLDILRLAGVEGGEVLALPIGFIVGVLVELVIMLTLFTYQFSFPIGRLIRVCWQASLASMVGAVIAYLSLIFVVEGVNQERFLGIFIQGGVAGLCGLLGVVATYYLVRSDELHELVRSFKTRVLRTDVVAPQPDIL
jgi:putative peptidoglycan lipid II flippase